MKKFNFILVFFIAMTLLFVGCKKDNDKESQTTNEPQNETPEAIDSNGILPGLFSVGEGRQIHFSKGNLQYQGSTGLWRFAEQQYDFIGEGNEDMSASYSGWIDHFAWGTSGWEGSGAECYMPYCVLAEPEKYYVGGSYDHDLVGDYANADWGVYNAISNGGNRAGLWRTMTSAEWKYLFEQRPRAERLRAFATVCGHYGIVLLPDNWSSTDFSFTPNGKYYSNSYNAEVWDNMQRQGAVFIPAAGYRTVRASSMMDINGLYWSVNANSSQSNEYIFALVFNVGSADRNGVGGIFPNGESQRFLGCSVRLVCDAE